MDDIAVCLITIDNYDEVMDTMEDSRGPLLLARIGGHLNSMAQRSGGILQKFEKDRYLFILTHKALEEIKAGDFEILKQVREIDLGNKLPVTLSIGVGMNGGSLAKTMGYARTAIDLALGRGGDQALIKDGERYMYYGGNSREVVANTRVLARVKAYALKELIDGASNMVVMGHKNPDLDCIGSALGVYRIAQSQGKQCNVLLNGVCAGIELLYERLERGYRDEIFVTTAEAQALMNDGTLLIIVDCHRTTLLEAGELLDCAGHTVVFDHHRKSTEYIVNPVLSYHDPHASSTSELITEMIQYLGPVKLSAVEADALLAGINVDTKNFAVKTGAKTLEAAAFLHRNGADSLRVRMLFRYDMKFYKAKAAVVNNAEIIDGRTAISVCPPDTENAVLAAAQSADELLNISGIEAAYVLCDEGDLVSISARSLGDINVQRKMERLGGGGHQLVAGAQLKDVSIDEAMRRLKEIL